MLFHPSRHRWCAFHDLLKPVYVARPRAYYSCLVVLALASDKSPTEASNESAADIFDDVREPDASPAPSSRSRNLTERPLALWLLDE